MFGFSKFKFIHEQSRQILPYEELNLSSCIAPSDARLLSYRELYGDLGFLISSYVTISKTKTEC